METANGMAIDPFGTDQWGTPPAPTKKEATKKKGFDAAEFRKMCRKKDKGSNRPGGRSGAIHNFLVGIFSKFIDLAKQAFEISISKFIIELCAMVIAGVGGAIAGKYKRPVEVTTAGVFYNVANTATQTVTPQAAQSPQNNLWGGSAFDSGWSSPRTSGW